MKKLLSMFIAAALAVQLSACAVGGDTKAGTTAMLNIYNAVNSHETTLTLDGEKVGTVRGEGRLLEVVSSLSPDEMKSMLLEHNPDIAIQDVDDREFLVCGKTDDAYILFSQNVRDENGNPAEDIYVVMSESETFHKIVDDVPFESQSVWYPYHLAEHSFTYTDNGDSYTLSINSGNPFTDVIYLRSSGTDLSFTDIVQFYQACGCDVVDEGGNLTGRVLFVSPDQNGAHPLRILVMNNGGQFAMQYCTVNAAAELQAVRVIYDYADALNGNDVEAYLSCFDETDVNREDVQTMLDGVISCQLNQPVLFWHDKTEQQFIFKASYTLDIKKDVKNGLSDIGLGEGTHELDTYFTVDCSSGSPKILTTSMKLEDCIRSLNAYQSIAETDHMDILVDWLMALSEEQKNEKNRFDNSLFYTPYFTGCLRWVA